MKKTLALIMAAALAGSSLAGCGGKADNSAPETKPAGSEADNGGAVQAEGTAEFPAIGTADAPVTVKVMIKDVFPDEEDVQLLREAINEKWRLTASTSIWSLWNRRQEAMRRQCRLQ